MFWQLMISLIYIPFSILMTHKLDVFNRCNFRPYKPIIKIASKIREEKNQPRSDFSPMAYTACGSSERGKLCSHAIAKNPNKCRLIRLVSSEDLRTLKMVIAQQGNWIRVTNTKKERLCGKIEDKWCLWL